MRDLVEGVLLDELGYTEGELSVTNDESIVYDFDFEENLPKKLSELGIKNDTILTVIDDDDVEKDPRVNLELWVVERYVGQSVVHNPARH